MKLHVKKDGTLYMKRPVPGMGWTTWQITQEGVDLLARKGVDVGDEIPEKVFEELLRRNYLYTGGSGPGEEVELATTNRSGWKGWGNGNAAKQRSNDDAKRIEENGCLGWVLLFIVLFVVYQLLT